MSSPRVSLSDVRSAPAPRTGSFAPKGSAACPQSRPARADPGVECRTLPARRNALESGPPVDRATRERAANPIPAGELARLACLCLARHQDYWEVKVADNRDHDDWREVHRLVWETERGPVPPGHVVILIDGDPDHCLDVHNLAAVPRRVLAQLNGAGWGRLTEPEERRTLLTMVQLIDAARARARQLGLSRRQIASTVPGIRWRRAE